MGSELLEIGVGEVNGGEAGLRESPGGWMQLNSVAAAMVIGAA